MNLRILARYPFVPEAKEYLKEISLDSLFKSDEYEDARNLGYMRVRSSLTGEKVDFPAPRGDYALKTIFLSFFVAKILLIALDDPLITRRFANIERDALEENLKTRPEDIEEVAKSLGLRFRHVGAISSDILSKKEEGVAIFEKGKDEFEIHFIDFIKYAKNFSTDEFRLVRQRLKAGWLPISAKNFIKIIREAFVVSFVDDVESQSDKKEFLKKYFKNEMEELKNLKDEYVSSYSQVDLGEVNVDAFPPCMKSIIAKIREGVNVSHEARFSMVAFLHQIGMSNDEILNIFATVPDFRKDLTLYQIRHITGEISGKEYKVPKCATLRSYGLCVRDMAKDPLCFKSWMSHPLLYYKIKKGGFKKEHARSKQNAEQR